MRLSPLLLLLPALAAAESQNPLFEAAQGWFEKAKSFIPTTPSAPVEAGAAKIAEKNVEKLNMHTWDSKLRATTSDPSKGPQEFMVLISGGNVSCFGHCGEVEKAWNESVAILSALPDAPRLGYINCDMEKILCSVWACNIPSIYHFLLPVSGADLSDRITPLHIIPLNMTTTTTQEIVKIHTDKTYKEVEEYTGHYHPINGTLAKFGLLTPLGYLLYGMGVVPSWAIMIVISFLSRNVMSRRAAGGAQRAPAPAQ